MISFAGGNPAAEAFPVELIAEITRDILASQPVLALQYSVSEGYTPLRDRVRGLLKADGIDREDDDLLIMSGAQQGIELTCKVLCNEGDVVIAENPSFIGALNAIRSYNTTLVGVDVEEDGYIVGQMEAALEAHPETKLIYVIPNFQNPTGYTTSLEKRRAVYQLCKQHGVPILEDNPYGELRFTGPPCHWRNANGCISWHSSTTVSSWRITLTGTFGLSGRASPPSKAWIPTDAWSTAAASPRCCPPACGWATCWPVRR